MIQNATFQVLRQRMWVSWQSAVRGLAALVLLGLIPGTVSAAGVLKSAEVTAIINDVKVVDPSAGERPASVSDVVSGQVGVKTGVKSRAELLFQDKTLTRLGANTLFSFNQGTRELELEQGTMLLQVPKNAGGAKIRTAAVTAAITGTTIMLEYSPVKWKPKHPPGVSDDVVKMAPEQCLLELQHPKRGYSAPDLAELRRKATIAQKNSGHVKVMVLEGTLRLFLNNRVGESTLIGPGQMVILSPTALTIPPSVNYDIAQLSNTSLLVNNANWTTGALEMAAVSREIAAQAKLKGNGSLQETNLVIPGGGTEVFTLAQINQALTAQNTLLQRPAGPQGRSSNNNNSGSSQNQPGGGPSPLGGGTTPTAVSRSPLVSYSPTTSSGSYPNAGPGTHTHSSPNSGQVSVGDYDLSEEIRGVVEFDISDATPGSTASLSFKVSKLESDFFAESGPGSFTINVLGYVGNNVADNADYNQPSLGLIGSFSTSGLTIGTVFTFDASSVLDAALLANAFSLGIRLEAASNPGNGIAISLDNFLLLFQLPSEIGPLFTISTPDPYIVDNTTTIVTDPTITTGGVTRYGRIYRNAVLDGAYTNYAFGSTSAYDLELEMGTYYAFDAAGETIFRFKNLVITGQPVINTTNGPKYLDLISEGAITSAAPGGTINLDAIDGLFLATVNGSITLGPELSFTSSRVYALPTGDHTAGSVPPGLYFEAYARGATSDVNIAASVTFTGDRRLSLEAERDVNITGTLKAPDVFLAAGRNVVFGTNGYVIGPKVVIWADAIIGAGGGIETDSLDITIGQTATISLSEGIDVNSLNVSGMSRFRVSAPSIQLPSGGDFSEVDQLILEGPISSNGNLAGVDVDLKGAATVTGSVTTSGKLGVSTLTASGAVNVGTLMGFKGESSFANASVTASSFSASGELRFEGVDGEIRTVNGTPTTTAPGDAQTLTITAATVSFGLADFSGGSAEMNSGQAGRDGGTLNVVTQNDVTLNSAINATTGASATGVASGGNGGIVDINSGGGEIAVNATIQVSSDDVPNRRVSAKGGNINLQTGKTTGNGITISNTGQLLSLLNNTAPGPGGTIQVTSAGADVRVNGKIQADRGTIDVRNNGANGNIYLGATSQLAADVVKVGALGVNGQLTISAGSRLNAVNTLKLYGGTGAGKVLFTGSGNVNLAGNQIHIRADTVQIDSSTHVNNNGATSVHATNHNYDPTPGSGGGKFQNPVTAGPTSGAPSF